MKELRKEGIKEVKKEERMKKRWKDGTNKGKN